MATTQAQPAASFAEAIAITPLSSHTYSANLRTEWCIGTVPHGGYVTSIFYSVARKHMKTTHPTYHKGAPDPITVYLTFIRRTNIGPALFTVVDTKLGSRTSTLHITLSQQDPDGNRREEVAGYITVSHIASEEGPSIERAFALTPPAPAVDLKQLASTGRSGEWNGFKVAFGSMRKASRHVEFYAPSTSAMVSRGFVEQWARFAPYGKVGRWTDETLGFLADMFPMMLESFDDKPWDKRSKEEKEKEKYVVGKDGKLSPKGKFWYPTILLNLDVKKKLPAEGAEWLYSRVQTKKLHNGRMDLDVIIMDEKGEVVALSNHVALVIGAERNLSARKGSGKPSGESKI
ncbi:hypothetical protein H109_04562 [Trichophyton interdigitale MR816]|uniref:Thioesterase-like superfamily-domain-containing protein n=1 Tax=Trichophyton interdigitale (strain MR816) TaxID=1215338 RepID=A0A059J6X5_TRIIM|nr:hypothetical protein H101_03981 [Trichophyton interdigitale H6]KDB23559.1 hypothetical protein H109_04562 [Trichophyton interdigitale MR816]